MKIHPRQFTAVIRHIGKFWSRGCKCIACQSVDLREQLKIKK